MGQICSNNPPFWCLNTNIFHLVMLQCECQVIDTTQFSTYTGTYYSEELAAEYKVDLADGQLMIHHLRLGDFELQADPATEDQFTCRIAVIRFVKGQQGKVTGFKMSGGKVKNLQFDKKF